MHYLRWSHHLPSFRAPGLVFSSQPAILSQGPNPPFRKIMAQLWREESQKHEHENIDHETEEGAHIQAVHYTWHKHAN